MLKRLFFSLFNLEGADFDAAEGWTLRFASDWAPPVVLLACVALVILVWQVYRREGGTASPRYKLMLAALRVFALAVLVFILLRPAVIVARSELKESYVVLLLDRSDSMKLEDKYRDNEGLARLAHALGLVPDFDPNRPVDSDVVERVRAMSRADIANRILANPRSDVLARIAEHAKVRSFVFAATIAPAGQAPAGAPPAEAGPDEPDAAATRPPIIVPDGPVTQIGESIRDAVAALRGQRVAAMVVLSDWNSNSGLPPVEATRYALDARWPFPIFTVGVGDPAEQRDIALASVSANAVAFLNDPLVFNVAIEQSGYDGALVPLELYVALSPEGDALVAAKNVTLRHGRHYYTITHRPEKKGVFKYVVSAPPREDELSDANNTAEHTVTVKDDKLRVLLVAAGPTWEWRYLKTALFRDDSVHVTSWLQAADAEWVMAGGAQLRHFPLNRKELVDNYDVILMLGPSPDAFSDEQLEHVRSFVGDFGGGLIFCAGELAPAAAFDGTPLGKCLPVRLEPPSGFGARPSEGRAFKLHVTPEGWDHPAMRLTEDPHLDRELWERLPGLFWFHPVEKAKPGARVLAVHPEEKLESGKGLPLLVEHRYGAGKVFFCATDETWRWRFLLGDKYFYRFWRQTAGLVAANKLLGNAKRLTLDVARNRYTVGQTVDVEARVLDDMLRPSDRPAVTATVDLPGGGTRQLPLDLARPEQGIYRGSFIPRKIGDYAVRMRLGDIGEPETARFSVAMSTLENESRRLDLETMDAVAKKTSGAALAIAEIGRLPELITAEAMNVTTEHPVEIWDSWGCLLLFLLPLACEWWLRKRRLLI